MPDDRKKTNEPVWGSDVVAAALREQKFPYVCLNPGASYRGLHDSIVNYLGNEDPRMVVCLHEEHAIAIAHGYAQVTDEPICAIVHSNVGLLHATMAIFNAWCARVPVLILGATGPVDSTRRRPWIDWIHTSADQGGAVRNFTKWDDQPGSPAAAQESIRRATMIARTRPRGPVYINLDVGMQEQEYTEWPEIWDAGRFHAPEEPVPAPGDLDEALDILQGAKNPVIFSGRTSRDEAAWAERIQLAEALGAKVYTLSGDGASFPTSHPLHARRIGFQIRGELRDELRQADALLNLDWTDLGGTLKQIWPAGSEPPSIVGVSVDFHLHGGWNMDYMSLAPVDLRVATTPEAFVSAMLERMGGAKETEGGWGPEPASDDIPAAGEINQRSLATVFRQVTDGQDVCLAGQSIAWPADLVRADHPLDALGGAGGGGLGAGPGIAVGAALALKHIESSRLPVAIVGDGDFLMGCTALWTAAANDIPLLVITANNRAYYNDVLHQERVAVQRGRAVENKFIGQRIDDPPPDLAGIARAQGFEAAGPITDISELRAAIEAGVERVRAGAGYLIDVIVTGG